MHNNDKKQCYLDDVKGNRYEKSTIDLLKKIFHSTELEEDTFNKDVSEFNLNDVIELLKSYNSKSRRRLKSLVTYLDDYYQWCLNKEMIPNRISPFKNNTLGTVIDDIVPVEVFSEKFFTKDDIIEYQDNLSDDMNKFILIQAFYGILGEDYCEMTNLKIEDLDEENKTVKLITGRVAKVDDFYIESMKKASIVEFYNSAKSTNARNINGQTYVKNGYVIRGCASSGDLYDNNPVRSTFISQRISQMKKQFDNKFVTIPNLNKNGLVDYIKEKYKEQGISLKTALLQKTAGRYDYNKETQGYIDEFGSLMQVRMLRMQIEDFIEYFDTEIYSKKISSEGSEEGYGEGYKEGKEKYVLHRLKERNYNLIKEAKNKFKKHHDGKLFCDICKFNFFEKYGVRGENFIEGHHKIPLSELKQEDITKVDDIALVCSNCHKMLHRRKKCISIDELREIVKQNKLLD